MDANCVGLKSTCPEHGTNMTEEDNKELRMLKGFQDNELISAMTMPAGNVVKEKNSSA